MLRGAAFIALVVIPFLAALDVVIQLSCESAMGVYFGGNYISELRYSFTPNNRLSLRETVWKDISWIFSIL